jgi:cation:H+ antiporter
MPTAVLTLAGGLVVLFVGGHYLVRGAVAVALLGRVSTAVVALTIVAMGTSLPELAVSLAAASRGSTDLAYGNIVGSCIFNIGAILGFAALVSPIAVRRQAIRVEYPILFIATAAALLLARDGSVDRIDGGALVLGLAAFIGFTVYLAKRGVPLAEAADLEREVQRAAHIEQGLGRAWTVNLGWIAIGLVALVVGAEFAVAGAVRVARGLGVGERVIGLTVVAMGTSLPELATSIVATRRGEPEIALGNVVGSNIFNLLGILGITAAIFAVPVHARAMAMDNWVMLAFTVLLFPMMLQGRRVTRANAVVLLAAFVAYLSYVVMVR